MPDYEKMYKTLLDGVEKAIAELKKVELECDFFFLKNLKISW